MTASTKNLIFARTYICPLDYFPMGRFKEIIQLLNDWSQGA